MGQRVAMTHRTFALAALLVFAVGCQPPAAKPTNEPPKTDGKTASTGLQKLGVEVIKKGVPPRWAKDITPSKAGDTIFVRYTGKFKDGKVFDTNDPAQKPEAVILSFRIGDGGVIKGWEDGLVNLLPGAEVKLSVPWKDAYGEGGNETIPGKSDLYFDVKVVDLIKDGQDDLYGVNDVKVGTGATVKNGSKVTIRYRVEDVEGTEIEDTIKMKRDTTFTVGKEEIIVAIDMAMVGMKVGGVREVYLPAKISYRPMEQGQMAMPQPSITRIQLLSSN